MASDKSEVDVESFKEWVARNSSAGIVTANYETLHSLLETATLAQGQPVVSNGRLVGPGAQEALLADQNVQQARASGDEQAVLNALAVSPATGCAMVLTLAMQASGYNPASPAAAGNLAGFASYVQQVLLCPVFSAQINDRVQLNTQGDWNSVINQIVSYYVGIAASDLDHIRSGLLSLAQAASSNPSTNQTENLFVQNTLNAGSQLVVYMYQSFVQMNTTVQSGGKHSPDTVTNNAQLALSRVVLVFNSGSWPAYSLIIMPHTSASLEDWLNNTTTPQGSVAVNWTHI